MKKKINPDRRPRRCKVALAITMGMFCCYATALLVDQSLVSPQLNSVIVGALVLANLGALAALMAALGQARLDELGGQGFRAATHLVAIRKVVDPPPGQRPQRPPPAWNADTVHTTLSPRVWVKPQGGGIYQSGRTPADEFTRIIDRDWDKANLDERRESTGDVTPA